MATIYKNLSDYKKEQLDVNPETRIGIVVSEWNEEITNSLAEGALQTLIDNGISKENIVLKYVPGTFELPLGAKWLVDYSDVDSVLCLGCVIQGETRHFDFICEATAISISKLGMESGIPIIFGVLTTNTIEQAKDRAGGKHGNKGVEAAVTALKMISLIDNLTIDDFEGINLN